MNTATNNVKTELNGSAEANEKGHKSLTELITEMDRLGRLLRVDLQQEVVDRLKSGAINFEKVLADVKRYFIDTLDARMPKSPIDPIEEKIRSILGDINEWMRSTWGTAVKDMVAGFGTAFRTFFEGERGAGEGRGRPGGRPGGGRGGGEGESDRANRPGSGRGPGGRELPPGYERLPGGMVRTPGGIIIPENSVDRTSPPAPAPAPAPAPPGEKSWWRKGFDYALNPTDAVKDIYKGTKNVLGAATDAVSGLGNSVGTWVGEKISGLMKGMGDGISNAWESIRTNVKKYLPDMSKFKMPEWASNITKGLGEKLGGFGKWIAEKAGIITAIFSGLEVAKDVLDYKAGDIDGFELGKKVTSNVASTIAAWFASTFAASTVAAGVTAATAGTGAFGPAEIAGFAAGVATFHYTNKYSREYIDSLFDKYRPGWSTKPSDVAPAAPVTPNKAVPNQGTPVSALTIEEMRKAAQGSPELLAKVDRLAQAVEKQNRTGQAQAEASAQQILLLQSQIEHMRDIAGHTRDNAANTSTLVRQGS